MAEPRANDYWQWAEAQYKSKRWRNLRKRKLRKDRYCACPCHRGIPVEANIVDHKDPHRGDSRKFWDELNLQSLCKPCHDSCKQSEERRGQVIGCDASGLPIDPDHPWNNENTGPQ